MGKLLTETPVSEALATAEIIDRYGVTREHLKKFRVADAPVHEAVVRLLKYGLQVQAPKMSLPSTSVISGEEKATARTLNSETVRGVTYFTVVSDGRIGHGFVRTWEGKLSFRSKHVKDFVCDAEFIPTSGVVYRIALISGREFLCPERENIVPYVDAEAKLRGYSPLPFEAACLLCEVVTEDELQRLGLYALNCMHQSMTNGGGGEHIARLRLVKYQQENIVLNVDYTKACFETGREGYAYLVSQTPTNS